MDKKFYFYFLLGGGKSYFALSETYMIECIVQKIVTSREGLFLATCSHSALLFAPQLCLPGDAVPYFLIASSLTTSRTQFHSSRLCTVLQMRTN